MAKTGQSVSMATYDSSNSADRSPIRIRPSVLLAVWSAPALISCFQRWASSGLDGHQLSFWHIVALQLPGWYAWASMTPAIFLITRAFPLTWPPRGIAAAAHVFTCAASAVLHAIVTSAANLIFEPPAPPLSFLRFVGVMAFSWLPSTFLLYAATVGVALWMQSIHREKLREREGAVMSVQLARAELNALRSQIHPHFLFNTLNTIAILIRERDTDTAARLVTQLGDILRQVIYGTRTHETALDGEIALVSTYLEIEQVRFGERLSIRWAIDDDVMNAAVPSLVLQPLVENALRHGIASLVSQGVVEIGARRDGQDLLLWVADNGSGIEAEIASPRNSGHVGLTNTRERLARLYPGQSSLRVLAGLHGGTKSEIRLPLKAWPAPATGTSAVA